MKRLTLTEILVAVRERHIELRLNADNHLCFLAESSAVDEEMIESMGEHLGTIKQLVAIRNRYRDRDPQER